MFFFRKNVKFYNSWNWRKKLIPKFASNNWQSCHGLKLRVEWNVLFQNSFFYCFHGLNIVSGVYGKQLLKVWWKFYGRVAKASIYVSRTMFFVAKFVFIYSVFDFQEKQLWLPEKIFIRVLGKVLYESRWSMFGEKALFETILDFYFSIIFELWAEKKNHFWKKDLRQSF